MKLQLYVCPACGRATLYNSSSYQQLGQPRRCMNDAMEMSWVHEVDLRPADQHLAKRDES